jgi:predicted RNase H-like nuclease
VLFLGIDLGWISQPSGLAVLESSDSGLHLRRLDRRATHCEVLDWVDKNAGNEPAMLAIDAPLIMPNASGIRPCEREVNREFRPFHAGCHAANQGRPFWAPITALVAALESRGFHHAAAISVRTPGRYMIEVHPHAASVNLFGLDRIIKYKKGRVADRTAALARYRRLVASLVDAELPRVPAGGHELKAVEDKIDAVLAAYIGAQWWLWGEERSRCYGDEAGGYIVVPKGKCPEPRV